jgi:RNA polymerase sigma-70 factor (ECF subfamily)
MQDKDNKSRDLTDRDRAEQFLALHTKNHHRLSAFVHTLVPDWEDAEEIVQDALTIAWRKFDEFDPATDFFRWVARVAQFEVLNYRRKMKRQALMLDAEVINALAVAAAEASADFNQRREALGDCLRKLPDRERLIVRLRYRENGTVHTVAEAIGRSTNHVHRILRRIRERLLRCVQARLSQHVT